MNNDSEKRVGPEAGNAPADLANPDPSPPETGNEPPPPAGAHPAREIGGRKGPDPTRYGDWEKAGRCIDF